MNAADPGSVLSPSPGRSFLGHPIGLATIFFTEMWERLSFYGMRALLILYLVDAAAHGGMGLDDRTAASIYGLYVGGTYIACLPGGWFGDRLVGSQRAVLLGGIVIAIGHLLLGVAPTHAVFFVGLLVIVLGTGLLKPNASALVSQLYPEGGARRDAGFTIYYIGVNLGGLIGPLIAGALAVTYGWTVGFMTAAVGMSIGVLQFLLWRRLLGGAGRTAPVEARAVSRAAGWRWVVGALVVLAALVAACWSGMVPVAPTALSGASTDAVIGIAVLYFVYLLFGAGLKGVERLRILAVIVLFTASVLFWAGYEQAGSSFSLFAERYTNRHLLGWEVPASWFQSLSSVYILLFGAAFSSLWLRLGARGLDPSAPVKFIIGLLLLGSGFVLMAAASRLVLSQHQVGMGWLTLTFLLHTWGELCLSPVGMSAVSKLVPPRFVGQCLGVWFVSLSLGNLLAGRIAGDFDPAHLERMPGQYLNIFWFTAACAAAVTLSLPLMRRWSAGVR